MFESRKNFEEFFKSINEIFEAMDVPNGQWEKQTRVSEDGTYRVTSYFYNNGKNESNNSEVKVLKSQLEMAIENEDFEKAVELRDKIRNLESNQKEITKLELELKKSIEEQNFERSIEIRDQLKKLR